MAHGKSGMGSHKHGTSGYSTQSPRFRAQRLLDLKKREDDDKSLRDKKEKARGMKSSVSELFR